MSAGAGATTMGSVERASLAQIVTGITSSGPHLTSHAPSHTLLHPLLQSNLQPFLDLFLTPDPPDALAAPSWRFDVSMTWTASLPWTGGCEAQGDQWPLGEACRRLGAPRRGEASDRRQAQLAKAWRGKPRDSQGRVDGFFHIIGDGCQTSR